MTDFSQKSRLEFSARDVFDWHKQDGAFERLRPPWMDIDIIDRNGKGIENGVRLTVKARMGIISSELQIEHTDYIEGKQFKDIQCKGPFACWEHSHLFHELSEKQTEMEDLIRYQLPEGLDSLANLINPWINRELIRLFHYRHTVLKHDLEVHQGVEPMKILITGSSGLVGSALVPFLTTGRHQVFKLVRTRANLLPHELAWDPERGVINPELLEGMDAVIHLAGENIASRWTESKKKRIFESRVQGTRLLCRALSQLQRPPSVLISASAIGYYGNQGDHILTEESPKGSGFLADVCQEWEAATQAAEDRGIRTIHLRTGMVLSPRGGALKNMLTPFKLGLGGEFGSGDQYISWISIDDLLGIIYYALRQASLAGPVNAVSPYPVTNREFTKTLGAVLHRPTFFKVPAGILKWIFGQMADELLMSSQRVIPAVLEEKGFRFDYPELDQALKHLL